MIRLNKALAKSGICSRREADYYIKNGMVLVNKVIVNELGIKINEHEDKFELSSKAEQHIKRKISILYNKPLGIVSSQPEDAYIPAIAKLTKENQWDSNDNTNHRGNKNNNKSRSIILNRNEPCNLPKLGVCGRLDINSTGLLFFTQDGTLAKRILSKTSTTTPIEKEYLVRVDKLLQEPTKGNYNYENNTINNNAMSQKTTQHIIDKFQSGIYCTGDLLKASSVQILNENQLKIVLIDGKHHQIRRMCSNVGLQIMAIKRVRIGELCLANLPVGKWRYYLPGIDYI